MVVGCFFVGNLGLFFFFFYVGILVLFFHMFFGVRMFFVGHLSPD